MIKRMILTMLIAIPAISYAYDAEIVVFNNTDNKVIFCEIKKVITSKEIEDEDINIDGIKKNDCFTYKKLKPQSRFTFNSENGLVNNDGMYPIIIIKGETIYYTYITDFFSYGEIIVNNDGQPIFFNTTEHHSQYPIFEIKQPTK